MDYLNITFGAVLGLICSSLLTLITHMYNKRQNCKKGLKILEIELQILYNDVNAASDFAEKRIFLGHEITTIKHLNLYFILDRKIIELIEDITVKVERVNILIAKNKKHKKLHTHPNNLKKVEQQTFDTYKYFLKLLLDKIIELKNIIKNGYWPV